MKNTFLSLLFALTLFVSHTYGQNVTKKFQHKNFTFNYDESMEVIDKRSSHQDNSVVVTLKNNNATIMLLVPNIVVYTSDDAAEVFAAVTRQFKATAVEEKSTQVISYPVMTTIGGENIQGVRFDISGVSISIDAYSKIVKDRLLVMIYMHDTRGLTNVEWETVKDSLKFKN